MGLVDFYKHTAVQEAHLMQRNCASGGILQYILSHPTLILRAYDKENALNDTFLLNVALATQYGQYQFVEDR